MVSSEENEDFLREIEILGDQSFLDLHDILVDECGLQGYELASFYLCDNSWTKLQEISLLDMSIDEKPVDADEDEDENETQLPVKVMENTEISEIVKKKHQRLIYEYDFLSPVVLFLECVEVEDTEGDDYPMCLSREGSLDHVGGDKIDEDRAFGDELLDEDEEELGLEDEIEDEFNDLMDGADDDMY